MLISIRRIKRRTKRRRARSKKQKGTREADLGSASCSEGRERRLNAATSPSLSRGRPGCGRANVMKSLCKSEEFEEYQGTHTHTIAHASTPSDGRNATDYESDMKRQSLYMSFFSNLDDGRSRHDDDNLVIMTDTAPDGLHMTIYTYRRTTRRAQRRIHRLIFSTAGA